MQHSGKQGLRIGSDRHKSHAGARTSEKLCGTVLKVTSLYSTHSKVPANPWIVEHVGGDDCAAAAAAGDAEEEERVKVAVA
jgi:hypothetical protein